MNGFSPAVMHDAFMIKNNKYNQRNFQCLYYINKRSTKIGTEIVTYREPQIWNLVPKKTKSASSFKIFKKKIRKWKGEKCPCRKYKNYIQHLGLERTVHILLTSFTFLFIFLLCLLWGVGLSILISS